MADIYSTPGSAVAETVQAILQQRRDQQRQLMLDRLGIEKFKSDDENQKAQLDLQRQGEERMGRVSDANIAADQERLFNEQLDSLGYGRRDVSGLEQSNPELFNKLMERQLIEEEPAVTPRVGTATDMRLPEGATPEQIEQFDAAAEQGPMEMEQVGEVSPARKMFVGSKDYQQVQDARNRITGLMQDPAFAENKDLREALMLMQGGAINQVPDELVGPAPTVTPISPSGRALPQIQLPRRSQAMELPWAPQPNAASQPFPFHVDTDNDGIPEPYWLRPGEQPTPERRIGGQNVTGVQRGNMPANREVGYAPAALWTKYTDTQRRVQGESEEAHIARRQQARQALAVGINPNSMSPIARQLVAKLVNGVNQAELSGIPFTIDIIKKNIANHEAAGAVFSPKDKADIETFMRGIISSGEVVQ